MSEKPAFAAIYTTFRHLKGSGSYKVELEIPPNQFQQMLDVLGLPPGPGETKWVGVAMLDPELIGK